MGSTSRRYPPELKERAVRLVLETIEEEGDEFGVITRVAQPAGDRTGVAAQVGPQGADRRR